MTSPNPWVTDGQTNKMKILKREKVSLKRAMMVFKKTLLMLKRRVQILKKNPI
ncbi:hypothetical protein JG687_00005562 [Phytophthora cactorum]|uniref:Uncharacterized protein n=1 Tax=Phytophthora cactorum TaxID=29920 RepID=A0A329SXV6_9STRA|nr:hypothetical protein Pcac1_g6329 [Phytophthora cactorum]KAG2845396.1 hypothetical protein PC112_g1882 [Phytophthora cactorum]KAG2846463.1 hypothetical protein PC111_g1158 [Phytophthora cactorum]KAG2867575.1 hypothetical protein PC113_g1830 [Phytophthora cactorum]KAG2931364.1 hypothetical protein PC114_g2213 [Phytophthora cactorum]